MYQMILMLSLFPTQPEALTLKPITTCQFPNPCAIELAVPITTCQFPNPCVAEVAAPITTCQFPNPCAI